MRGSHVIWNIYGDILISPRRLSSRNARLDFWSPACLDGNTSQSFGAAAPSEMAFRRNAQRFGYVFHTLPSRMQDCDSEQGLCLQAATRSRTEPWFGIPLYRSSTIHNMSG